MKLKAIKKLLAILERYYEQLEERRIIQFLKGRKQVLFRKDCTTK